MVINPIVGVDIPIKRIPVRWDDHPQYREWDDPGTLPNRSDPQRRSPEYVVTVTSRLDEWVMMGDDAR